jgi:putative redox protein
MAEKVMVRQNSHFETEILAQDPHNPDDPEFHSVVHLHQLTPYGMLLAGLASCTTIVLHTYAQHHGVDLHEVELTASYDRVFVDDCEECEGIDEYREQIDEGIVLKGHLTEDERKRLYMISKHCPIHKMLIQGIRVNSQLSEEVTLDTEE